MSRSILLSFLIGFAWTAAGQTARPAPDKVAAKEIAIFAGGCFWCMEAPFDSIPGVSKLTVGYIGGQTKNPSYAEVSAGRTGHTEAVQIVFDPKLVTYEKLLGVFWKQIDPVQVDAQFCDQGNQYRSGIFYENEQQRQQAEASKEALAKSGRLKGKIATEVTAASTFYPAEDYHQQYYKKNPVRYKYYRFSCGRDKRLDEIWGKDRGSAHP